MVHCNKTLFFNSLKSGFPGALDQMTSDIAVFQADSTVVNAVYRNNSNYIIDHNLFPNENYCVLYFSSNDLYYPNNETAFEEQLIKKNRYEWFKTRINNAAKHIFLRDIKKQWYLTGISAEINTPQKLQEFLKKETEGYKVIAIGSSAGGFAAVIHGQLLHAERIYTFNGQFEILSLLKESNTTKDPIIFRNADNQELLPYYNAANFITIPSSIYYFQSSKSKWDKDQNRFIKGKAVNRIYFKTSNHGIPFLKSNLDIVLNLEKKDIDSLVDKTFYPLLFSLKIAGLRETVSGLKFVMRFVFNKVFVSTILKLKNNFKKGSGNIG
jgi:hypothetical protein